MNRLFSRNRRRTSVPETVTEDLDASDNSSFDTGRRYSTPESNAIINDGPALARDDYDLSPTSSVPLSETATLMEDKLQRLELQETFNDNFDHYLPFLLRRLRNLSISGEAPPYDNIADVSIDNDDQPTILNEPLGDVRTDFEIMNRNTSNYNLKRSFIIAGEFMKSNNYLFPSQESFNTFKRLRSAQKKHRKSSTTVYDNSGNIKVLKKEANETAKSQDHIIDPRNHIIPLTEKMKGIGLPIFRTHVPYMSNFKKNAPFIVFHKYKEYPEPPRFNDNNDLIEEEFQTFQFCAVYVKKFQDVKRYTFEFTLDTESPVYKVILFQHCYKPFSDFNYKDTRFRIIGTPIISAYALTYNPTLKLLIVDNDKPSLCDDVINKKPGFELSSLVKKNKPKAPVEDIDLSKVDTNDYPNPHPHYNNPLLRDDFGHLYGGIAYSTSKSYIPNNLPPFGGFKDALVYREKINIVPKKYSEVGRIEVYQDNSDGLIYPDNLNERNDVNSTKSVDEDNLILSCILLTMREVSIRSTARPTTSSVAISNRIGGFRGFNPATGAINLAL